MSQNSDRYTYRITWSEDDGEFVGLCVEFPSLSRPAKSPEAALKGIRRVVEKPVQDMENNAESPPTPISGRSFSGKFVVRIPPEVHRALAVKAPDATEAISYGIPTFKLHGNLVHFAAYKNHIGFYPTSGPIEAFKKELSGYKRSKGTVQFPINQSLPLGLIRTIVKYRVKENAQRQEVKK
jgi:uncharacterized protein YdhG (YjbR/CyaY superfamily)/predicted RNase H-like HicB family nuclease